MILTHISKLQLPFSVIFGVLISSVSFTQTSKVSLLFVGDVMQHDGQIEAAFNEKTNSYEYDDGFKYVRPIIEEYDIRVANLEVTHAGKPYKGYPQFSAPDELSKSLINAGFNVILTANNHSCDGGSKGVVRTLDVLDALGVKHTGTFRNLEERNKNYPLIVEQDGIKIAMLNYTYGTNGLSVSAPLIVNYIDSLVIKKDIERAQQLNVDYIVCNMHWGTEYKSLPNNYQKRFETYCYDLGVDMVIGGHPHVLQPIQKKTVNGEEKLTVWSLGNFVSNMKIRYTRGGVMVGATIYKENNTVKLGEVNYCLVYVYPKTEGKIKNYYILPEFDYNAYRPGFLSQSDSIKMSEFLSDSRTLYNEHNTNTTEYIVSPNSPLFSLYKNHLIEYYTVLLPMEYDKLLSGNSLDKYIHRSVAPDGSKFLFSGIYSERKQAEGNLQFIMDCGIQGALKIVKVTPNGIIEL